MSLENEVLMKSLEDLEKKVEILMAMNDGLQVAFELTSDLAKTQIDLNKYLSKRLELAEQIINKASDWPGMDEYLKEVGWWEENDVRT